MSADGALHKVSLRHLLRDTHVGIVTIAVLLASSLYLGIQAVWDPLFRTLYYLFETVAILDLPYLSFTLEDRSLLVTSFSNFLFALLYAVAAWLLSKRMYGRQPLETLRIHRARLMDTHHV